MRDSTRFALQTIPIFVVLSIVSIVLGNIIWVYVSGIITGVCILTIFVGRMLEKILDKIEDEVK